MVEPDLSIVILNYNVRDLLVNCLASLIKNKSPKDNWQIIVVDNASSDGSVEAIKEKFEIATSPKAPRNDIALIESKENLGFAGGNNLAIPKIKAPVVLFLNPDTLIVGDVIQKCLEKLHQNPDLGAITCKVELPDGKLDYSCHRGFPTPWNSFSYFTGLSKLFPKSKLFSGYTASYLNINEEHEIDCCTGAFLMVRKIACEQIKYWDTDYFWNGEDIEFCYSLKEKGWKIYYYPKVKIIHYKGSSSSKEKSKTISHGSSAMRIFYKKHFYKNYPPLLRDIILAGIRFLELYRKLKIYMSS